MNLGDPKLVEDGEYQALLGQLASRYPLQTIVVDLDQSRYFFTRVQDAGNVPLDLDSSGQLLWQPYWAEDWESSRAVCRQLLSMDLAGASILDLGCGLGLTGAIAAEQGAFVVLADNAEPALEISRINCWRWRDRCRFELIDWSQSYDSLGRFDWIVGAEIIYDTGDWDDLDRFWKKHLEPEGGVLLCDPFRRTGKEFRSWVLDRGWVVSFSEMAIPEFDQPVNMIELKFAKD